MVRHVPAGNRWHKAKDQLAGTEVYGTPCGTTCAQEWSIKFDEEDFDEFLFATGDEKKWLIADKDAVYGFTGENIPRTIIKSSVKSESYTARWYKTSALHHPWISVIDHQAAKEAKLFLYAGNHETYLTEVLQESKGANVFIRRKGEITVVGKSKQNHASACQKHSKSMQCFA